jgi:protein SCO1/2
VATTTTRRQRPGPRRRDRHALAAVAVAMALFLAAGAASVWLLGNPAGDASTAPVGGPFQLVAGDGRTVTDQDFRGKYMLIYFGYTTCPDACPTTLQSVAVALDRLGPKADWLQPLLITVDPQRDTPAVLAQYTAAFSPRLLGLSGTKQQIEQVEHEYRIYAAIHRTGPGPDDYAVDHGSMLYLVGPTGQVVAPLRADASSDEIANTLKHFMS